MALLPYAPCSLLEQVDCWVMVDGEDKSDVSSANDSTDLPDNYDWGSDAEFEQAKNKESTPDFDPNMPRLIPRTLTNTVDFNHDMPDLIPRTVWATQQQNGVGVEFDPNMPGLIPRILVTIIGQNGEPVKDVPNMVVACCELSHQSKQQGQEQDNLEAT